MKKLHQIHELKINSEFFQMIVGDEKNFEIRFNDRNFQRGDYLRLREISYYSGNTMFDYTGNEVICRIWDVKTFEGLKEGYVILFIDHIYKYNLSME